MHRDAHREEIHGNHTSGAPGTGVLARHDHVEILLLVRHRGTVIVRRGPQQHFASRLGLVVLVIHDAQREGLNLVGLESIHLVDWPGHLELKTGAERLLLLHAEPLQQRLLVGVDHHETAAEKQHHELDRKDQRQLLLDVSVKPGLRHLETKLVIQRLRRGGDQPPRLAKQADQSAVVNQARLFAIHPWPVNLKDQRDPVFQGGNRDHRKKDPRNHIVPAVVAQVGGGQGSHHRRARHRAKQHVVRSRPEQFLPVHPGEAGRVFAHHEQDDHKQGEEHDRQHPVARIPGLHVPGQLNIKPQQAKRLAKQHQHREARHHPFLELPPGVVRRVGILRRAGKE